jgi:quinol monooxygenase YgiN
MTSNLYIIATITPKPEFFADAEQAILAIVPQTLEETGCKQFVVHSGSGKLFLYEQWDSQAALDAHYTMPYVVPVFTAYKLWLAEAVEIHKMKKLV